MSSNAIASLALFVSALSLAVSWWGTFRDRVSLNVTALIRNGSPEYGPPYISAKVVNKGRRVAVLTMFGGDLADGGWQGTHLGKDGTGVHLAENQFHERKFFAEDIDAISPDSSSEFVSLWFEDSHGRRHKVPRATQLLGELALTAGPAD